MKKACAVFLLLLAVLLLAQTRQNSGQESFALAHVTLVDVADGSTVPDVTVLITGNQIADVGKSDQVPVPAGTKVVNAEGKFLIPGLWDMHVHWYDKRSLPLFTANGVTGIRQMFGTPELLRWRQELADGSLQGPRMIVASPILDGPRPFWPNSIAVGNEGEGRKAVLKVKKWGADFVKVYSFLPRDAYFGIAEEAKEQGIPFAGHVPWSVSAAEASDAGQKSIEHLTGVFMACSEDEEKIRRQLPQNTPFGARSLIEASALAKYDRRKAAALFQRFVKNGTWQCPTLTVLRSSANREERGFRDDPRLKYMPTEVRERWERRAEARSTIRAEEEYNYAKKVYPKYFELIGAMRRAGVQFLAGTDTGNPYCFPGFSLHDELALLVQAGLTPIDALRAATLNPSKFLGLDRSFGTIEKGKIADLVMLDANPLDDIRNTQKIHAVVSNGLFLDRDALDRMLARAR